MDRQEIGKSMCVSCRYNQISRPTELVNSLTKKMFRSSSVILVSLLAHIVFLTNLADGNLSSIDQQEPNENSFRDPIVWDSGSLYISDRNSNIHSHVTSRRKRSTSRQQQLNGSQQQVIDACQSKMEVLTPYYATNAKGNLRTIVNSELMQQAIQVETCVRSSSSQGINHIAGKCNAQPDCGCEQKYKWHRLLVLDQSEHPTSAPKGLFMDWFLFPSNCVCRCRISPTLLSSKHFIKTITSRKA